MRQSLISSSRRPYHEPSQRGSITLIVLAIIFIAALGFATWWVWDRNQPDDSKDMKTTITMGVFGQSLTTQVAEAEGYLEDENIKVEYKQVTGSEQQFEALRDGEYDLILTSPDNVVQYRVNNSNALGGTFDVQAIAGTNKGNGLSLVVQPEIESYEDLRNETLAVDSPDSGFAYALYQMMRNHGLEPEDDYQLTEAGGASARYDALLANEFAGTLLLSGAELRAEAEGKRILESASEAIPDYLGGVIAGREAWVSDNRDAVERLLRAYQMANNWIFNPGNRDAAVEMIKNQPGLSTETAEKIYDVQLSPDSGLVRDQAISPDELRTVLQLRQDWGGFDEEQDIDHLSSPESGLYDTSYLE